MNGYKESLKKLDKDVRMCIIHLSKRMDEVSKAALSKPKKLDLNDVKRELSAQVDEVKKYVRDRDKTMRGRYDEIESKVNKFLFSLPTEAGKNLRTVTYPPKTEKQRKLLNKIKPDPRYEPYWNMIPTIKNAIWGGDRWAHALKHYSIVALLSDISEDVVAMEVCFRDGDWDPFKLYLNRALDKIKAIKLTWLQIEEKLAKTPSQEGG